MRREALAALVAAALSAGGAAASPADTLEVALVSAADTAEAAPEVTDDDVAEPVVVEAEPLSGDYADLQDRRLLLPVEGVRPSDLHDHFLDRRGRRTHHGIDIMAPRNTPIHAVEDGVIARLDARGGAGGITVYQLDPAGAFGYYYAHLERWADGLMEGDPVTRGQIIGYVGSSGNAPERSPHLHFAIHRLGPSQQPWVGSPLNPYIVFLP